MNTVLYARVSSKEQEKEGFSIPAQLILLKGYAKKHNFEIIREFIDIETAKKSGRTNFSLMIDFLKDNKEVCHILCEKTDRLYRNFKDYVILEDLDLNVHLVKENEILNKDSKSHQKLIHGIKVLMAKNYIDNLAEETRKGMLQKAHEGYYPSFAPFGYFNVTKNINGRDIKTISIDRSRAHLIKKIFELYTTRQYSVKSIADLMEKEGLKSRKGFKVYKGTIHQILRDPIYYGDFMWREKLYKGKHEAIISKDLYLKAQDCLDGYNRQKDEKKRNFAFTGLLTCGRCGCSITSEIKKERYIYYHCTRHKGRCGNKAIREEILIKKLGGLVKKIKIDEKFIAWIKEALVMSHQDEKEYHNNQIRLLQKENSKMQKRLDKIYIDKLDDVITTEYYQQKTNEWKNEQHRLLESTERHQKANIDYFEQGIRILELSKKLYSTYLQKDNGGKRKILNILLSNCTLNDGNLCPTYRKPFDLLAKGLSRSNWLPLLDAFRTFKGNIAIENIRLIS